jgi:hypothetical protein
MRRWAKTGGGATLVVAIGILGYRAIHPREPRYDGKTVDGWAKEWMVKGETQALRQIVQRDLEFRARVNERRHAYVIRALRTRDNRLWKPYIQVKNWLPGFLSCHLPQWSEPRGVRLVALNGPFFGFGQSQPDGSWRDSFAPLCDIALRDRYPDLRWKAVRKLIDLGFPREAILPVMLGALVDPDTSVRHEAVKWFQWTTAAPEEAVPILVEGLHDPALKSDFSDAIRSYGRRASFKVSRLVEIARTNDPAISSVARWALSGIDREAAARAGVGFN